MHSQRRAGAARGTAAIVSALLLSLGVGCTFDAVVAGAVSCTAEHPDCPTGYACSAALGRCVATTAPDRTPPSVVAALLPEQPLRRGAKLTLDLEVSEPLGATPLARVTGSSGALALPWTRTDGARHHFETTLDDTSPEGLALVSVDLVDEAGNANLAASVGTVTLDFTAPVVVDATLTAPRGADAGLLEVRAGERVGLRLSLSEVCLPVAVAGRSGTPGCAPLEFRLGTPQRSAVSDSFADTAAPQAGCLYELVAPSVSDLAGNASSDVALGLRVRVDGTGPAIRGFDGGPQPDLFRATDAGWTPATLFSRAPGFDVFAVGFQVEADVVSLAARFASAPLTSCTLEACAPAAQGWRTCWCERRVVPQDTEPGGLLSLVATDGAGNTSSATLSVRFDFSPPRLLPNTASVALTPPAGSLVPTVSKATVGTGVSVRFALDEAATTALDASPSDVAFTFTDTTATTHHFEATVGAGTAEVLHTVTVRATDVVGNTAALPLPVDFEVDTTPPAAPDVERDAGVEYLRVPWGTADSGVRFEVRGAPGTVEPNATVVASDLRGSEAGRGRASADGGFFLGLSQADRAALSLQLVDAAGNVSPRVGVKHVRWIASLRGASLQDPSANPNAAETRPYFTHAATVARRTPTLLPTRHATGPAWTRLLTPGGRVSSTLVYDARRGQLVLFGGSTPATVNEVWEYDGLRWRAVPSVEPWPSSTSGHEAAFVAERGTMISYGGQLGAEQTWEYDGHAWANLTPTDGGGPHGALSMAYDVARRRLVLYGPPDGTPSGAPAHFEWDGRDWTSVPVPDAGPGPRYGHRLVYDEGLGRVLLFGGAQSGALDVWSYDGQAWQLHPSTTAAPPLRRNFGIAHDSARRLTWVFGGGGPRNDLWAWDGGAWGNFTPSTGSPSARAGAAMAFDPTRGVVVMLGGATGSPVPLADLWEWDGTTWRNRSGSTARPAASFELKLAHDEARGVTVMYGWNGTTSAHWELDGVAWTNRTTALTPPRRGGHGVHYNPALSSVMVTGGFWSDAGASMSLDEHLGWNGSTWTTYAPLPEATRWHTVAYDSARNVTVLRAGRNTYEWSDAGWSTAVVLDAGSTINSAMAFDPIQRQTLQFGGASVPGSLSAWDGTGWFELDAGAQGPSARSGHVMAFDSVRGVSVVFGGSTTLGLVSDVWEWDGARWVNPPGAAGPSPRESASATFDRRRGATLVYGGFSAGSGPNNELWQWGRTFGERPQLVARFRLSAVGAPLAQWQRLLVRTTARGGGFHLDGGAVTGVELGVRDETQAFVTVARVPAGTLTWAAEGPAEVNRAVLPATSEVLVSVSPRGADTLEGAAWLEVDLAELEVEYRLP